MTEQLYRRRAGEPVPVWDGEGDVPEFVAAGLTRWADREGADTAAQWLAEDRKEGRLFLVDGSGELRSYTSTELARDYEPVPPAPDAPAVLGTPEGNAAVIAKLHEMAESVGMVFVPDPDKLARCGGLRPGWFAHDVERAAKRAEELFGHLADNPAPDAREALRQAVDAMERGLRSDASADERLLAYEVAQCLETAALARMGGGQ